MRNEEREKTRETEHEASFHTGGSAIHQCLHTMRNRITLWGKSFVSRAGQTVGLCGVGAMLLTGSVTPSNAGSIGLSRGMSAGVPVMVLTVDLNDPNVKVTGIMAQYGRGHAEKFADMIHRSHPTAAFTGTYFCERSLIPIGDIVVNGKLAHRGGVGTALCLTDDNQCNFVHPPHNYAWMDWSQYDFVCCAGPRLVTEGVAAVHPGPEGFHDPHLLGSATRLAVGLTSHNKLLFVTTRSQVQLGKMAKVMKRLGCVDAMNLDAGGSLGFYDHAKMRITPSRKLTNAILVYDDRERFARFKHRLAPGVEMARK